VRDSCDIRNLYATRGESDATFMRVALPCLAMDATTQAMANSAGTDPFPFVSCTAERRASCSALAEILAPADVLLGLHAATPSQAISGIARFVASRHGLSETAVRAGLAEREQIGSTALGFGIAIPHARLKGLSRAIGAFVRAETPIPFDAPDLRPVTDMLVLLVPWEATEEHLVMLAEAATMFSDRQFRDELRTCSDRDQVHARLTRRDGAR
jgi:nitrogen PTS system EIIA component